MKSLRYFITLLFISVVASSFISTPHQTEDRFPLSQGFVNDFEDIFTPEEEAYLDSVLTVFEDSTSIEIAIVTLDSNHTTGNQFDSYTINLANYWGVGKANKNNGVLIAVSASLRRIRINTGTGIEDRLPDQKVKQIINKKFIPNAAKGDFFTGTKNTTESIMTSLY
jgi:uncharacterized protein